jgi:long-chain fatty acid transport protein
MKMKKTIKLALVAAMALGTTSAFATNGSTMNGLGAKARGMASVGIGMSHGAESILANPALITSIKGTEISFGGTLFMPDVDNTNTMMTPTGPFAGPNVTSDADTFVIPSVSIAHKVNDNFYTGIGMWGTGGLGVDYRNANSAMNTQMQMVTSLQIMQFGVPLVYKMNSLSMGITPIIQYGTLDINYVNPMSSAAVGAGVGSDISMGYNLGLSYETGGLTLGAVYKSKIDMSYDGQLPTAVEAMVGPGNYSNNILATPAEVGIGASYTTGEHTIALDYKQIKWEDATGYQDFGWEDQDIIAVGYQYATSSWAVRMGYSKADSAVQDNTGKNLMLDNYMAGGMTAMGMGGLVTPGYAGLTNTFNALGFPGNVESHYSLGGTYNFSETVSIDLAYMYAPEVTSTFKNFMSQDISTKHSETSYSFQLNLVF